MPATNAWRVLVAQMNVGESYTPYNNSNAYIGVGDGTTPFDPSQTDLQGTNKARKGMESGYPQRSGNVLTFASVFGPGEATFNWQEYGVFNASTGGTMFVRDLQNIGSKPSNATWRAVVTVTITAS